MKTSTVGCTHCGARKGQDCTTRSGRRRRSAHRARWDAVNQAFRRPRRYVLNEDEPRFGLTAGDVLVCEPYWLDPGVKGTVLYRESDLFDPGCNVYWHQVVPVDGDPGAIDEMEHAVNLTRVRA